MTIENRLNFTHCPSASRRRTPHSGLALLLLAPLACAPLIRSQNAHPSSPTSPSISTPGAEGSTPAADPAADPVADPIVDPAPGDASSATQRPPTGAAIHGVVAGADGTVYQGVHVALAETGTTPPPPLATQVTDANGAFAFTNLRAGPFRITLSSRGFITRSVSGVLHAGENYDAQTIVLPLAGAASEVHVTASRVEIAAAQLNVEEKQRVLGLIPNFYISYDPNAAPLTSRQKFQLAWRSSIDPFTWAVTGAFAGAEQASNTFAGYGQGAQGYAKRFGANYADTFIATMLGGAVLPALLKQDPRYFVKGTGTVRARIWYAVETTVICKGDNGRWQPAYSSILGGIAAAGISNLYYPPSDREGLELTFQNAAIGLAEGGIENLFQEFLVRRLTPAARKTQADE